MRVSSFILVFATLSFLALPSFAEPYFAVREGMRCSSCHTNRNGGGKRTDLMSAHARELLHYPDFLGRFSNPGNYFNGEINQYVSVGGDLRTSATLVFQDKGINGSVHNDKAFRWRLNQTRLDVTQALLYGEIRLIPEYLSVYIDQRFQSTTDTREAFVLFKGLPWNGYVKGGRFFLPYGLQLQDDEAFIRGGRSYGSSSAHTGFSFDLQEAGGEIGFEPGPFSAVVAVTDGTPGYFSALRRIRPWMRVARARSSSVDPFPMWGRQGETRGCSVCSPGRISVRSLSWPRQIFAATRHPVRRAGMPVSSCRTSKRTICCFAG